jgi:hypothetical protein
MSHFMHMNRCQAESSSRGLEKKRRIPLVWMCAGAARAGLRLAGIKTRLSQGLHAHVRARKVGAKRQNNFYQGVMPQLAGMHIWRPLIYVRLAGSLSPSLLILFCIIHFFSFFL